MINGNSYIISTECLTYLKKDIESNEKIPLNEDVYRKIKEVKEAVFKSFHKGIYISKDEKEDKFKKTIELLNDKKMVFNGEIRYEECVERVDILEIEDEGVNIYIIDPSTKVTRKSILRGEFSYYILTKLGYRVNNIYVYSINNRYIRKGELDFEKLFKIKNIKDNIEKDIEEKIEKIKLSLKGNVNKSLHKKCIQNGFCKFINSCFKEAYESEVFKIDGHSISTKKKLEYFKECLKDFKNIYEITEKQKEKEKLNRMLIVSMSGEKYINKKKVREFLKKIDKFPIYFLDFETYQDAIPMFEGRRAYMQIPFQYSLHILKEGGKLEHKEFLGIEGTDTTRDFVKNLLKDIKDDKGVIVAYNSTFEIGIIKEMMNLHTDLTEDLSKLLERFVDIMELFKNKDIYFKEMEFSHSIKKVLPAMCNNEVSYEELEIQNGEMAMHTFNRLNYIEEKEKAKIRKSLLQYCALDTLAMVKIYNKLKELV